MYYPHGADDRVGILAFASCWGGGFFIGGICMTQEELQALQSEAIAQVEQATTIQAVQGVRVTYLGKKVR